MLKDKPHKEFVAGQRVTSNGPAMLRVLNPKGVQRFRGRVCVACRRPIMNHYVIRFSDPEKAGSYWCHRDATQFSPGVV